MKLNHVFLFLITVSLSAISQANTLENNSCPNSKIAPSNMHQDASIAHYFYVSDLKQYTEEQFECNVEIISAEVRGLNYTNNDVWVDKVTSYNSDTKTSVSYFRVRAGKWNNNEFTYTIHVRNSVTGCDYQLVGAFSYMD